MRKKRILLLMHDDLVPPAGVTESPEDHFVPWKTDFDVRRGLIELGHDVHGLGVEDEVRPIRQAIEEFKPHVVFNLLENFHGVTTYDSYVTSYLELLRQPYTGCNPRGLMLTRDKALSRKIMFYHRIPGPGFATFLLGRPIRRPARLGYPMLVKALNDDGSQGLSQASIVRDDKKLEERVLLLQESMGMDVIVEEYVAGREIYVPILGNRRLHTCPIIELVFGNLPAGAEPIATGRAKWNLKYQEKRQIELKIADLPEDVERRILRLAKRVYKALGLSGYARIDFRLTEEGHPYVIEANPNADLAFGGEFHESVESTGWSYGNLLQRVVNLGLSYEAAWRMVE